ncbi:exportin-4-like [Cimex lectularius]|uniref:Exportin-4 n=1 Tax=Cimex lectularius TaxID=79782 RepID=A0A8I6RT85_CIMLE|nr:exportin-4-like [Cimex lectularius]
MQVLHELEAAAKIMLAPPSLITPEQRAAAEGIFINFRKSKTPYRLCKLILENSGVDYVLFECGSTLKAALIREWKQLQPQEIVELRQYLLEFILHKPCLATFVREKILQVISIMVKRESVADFGQSRASIIDEVEKLILEGDLQKQTLCCSLLTSLMQEHGNTMKSSDVGLTWETHFKIKKQFEMSDLKKILTICIRALTELSNLPADSLLKQILALSEAVLSWGFVALKLGSQLSNIIVGIFEESYEAEQYPSLKLSASWKELLLEKNIVNLYFDVYWKIRDNPHLAHYALNCLVQLASLNGPVVSNKEQRLQYFSNYIELFIKLITNIKVLDREALGIANIIKNIITYYPPSLIVTLPPLILKPFLENLTRLTCFFTEEGNDYSENGGTYAEGLDTLLRLWLTMASDNSYLKDFVNQASCEIFHTYLKCHLAPPFGTRRPGEDDEETCEETSFNRDRLKDQLLTIGLLGRQAPGFSLPLLAKLLEDRTNALKTLLEEIASRKHDLNKAMEWLNTLYDDIHWIIMISGHVITLESVGEITMMPLDLLDHSIQQKASVETTLKLLVSPISEVPGAEEAADHIVRIVAAMLRLSELELKVNQVNLEPGFSTQIAENIMWFFRVWSFSYLMPTESYYAEISMALNCAFGQNSEGALWIVNNLLRKIEFNLRFYRSEVILIKETIQLLISLVDMREKVSCVLKSESFWALVESQQGQDKSLNTKAANSGVMKAFVLGGIALESGEKQEEYWGQIIKPIVNRMNEILNGENFKKTYQQVSVRSEIQTILELIIGVGQGGHVTTVHSLFAILAPFLAQCSHLTAIYCNYQIIIEDIFQLFCETARTYLTYLTPVETRTFYEACLNTIQIYARTNQGRKSIHPNMEEDTFNDIHLLMELLLTIYAKDCIDLSPAEDVPQSEPSVTATDICLYGLKILMPLMTIELLKCPTLSLLYYKIIAFVCELYPKKILRQEPALLEGILQTVQLGLQSLGREINALCCEFIVALGTCIFSEDLGGSCKLLVPFIKILMDMILCQQVNSSNFQNIGKALFVLMCCYKEEYQRSVQWWVDSQTDPAVAQRLANCFTQLTENIPLSIQRRNMAQFKESFEKFVVEVPLFLLVK